MGGVVCLFVRVRCMSHLGVMATPTHLLAGHFSFTTLLMRRSLNSLFYSHWHWAGPRNVLVHGKAEGFLRRYGDAFEEFRPPYQFFGLFDLVCTCASALVISLGVGLDAEVCSLSLAPNGALLFLVSGKLLVIAVTLPFAVPFSNLACIVLCLCSCAAAIVTMLGVDDTISTWLGMMESILVLIDTVARLLSIAMSALNKRRSSIHSKHRDALAALIELICVTRHGVQSYNSPLSTPQPAAVDVKCLTLVPLDSL